MIRPLATARLNKDPEKQARLWERALELGEGEPTESDVKEALKEEREAYYATLDFIPASKPAPISDALTIEERAAFRSVMTKAMFKNHPDHGGAGDPVFITMYKKIMNLM